MHPYLNLSGESGVTQYELGPDFIDVEFGPKGTYRYTDQRVGRKKVDRMKELAVAGRGLGTFINKDPLVKNGFIRLP
jgi:hypothetical protein